MMRCQSLEDKFVDKLIFANRRFSRFLVTQALKKLGHKTQLLFVFYNAHYKLSNPIGNPLASPVKRYRVPPKKLNMPHLKLIEQISILKSL